MALQTKTFQSDTTSNQFYLQLTLTENSTNQTNNTSSISYTLKLYSGGWDFTQYKIGHSIKLAGNTVSSVERANANQYSLGTNSSITIASGTTTITHDSDGSKNMSVAFSIDMEKASYTPGTISVSGKSMTLTAIPRASTISCSTAYIGSNATITINRASSSFTHTLTYTFGSLTGTIATKTSSTSISFALPEDFYAQMPNEQGKQGTIACNTYNGSTLIGSSSCNFIAKTDESKCCPTLSDSSYDENAVTVALTGNNSKMVKYYSNAHVKTNAKARCSATLTAQGVSCGSKSIDTGEGVINAVESGTFTFWATDSRNYTRRIHVIHTLIEYVKLTCSIEAGAATTSGVAQLKVSGNYWNGNFGAADNTLTIQYRYKANSGSYSNWTTSSASITKENNTYSTTINISGLNYLNAYTFQARAIDKLETVESGEQTRKTTPVFDWGKDDFNFNVPVTINGNLNISGNLQLDGNIYDYVVEQGTSNNWNYRKWNSGYAECWCTMAISNKACSTAVGSWYRTAELKFNKYPFTFAATPNVNMFFETGSGTGGLVWTAGTTSDVTSSKIQPHQFYIIRMASSTSISGNVHIQVKGKWK